jgi:hypothetical protein
LVSVEFAVVVSGCSEGFKVVVSGCSEGFKVVVSGCSEGFKVVVGATVGFNSLRHSLNSLLKPFFSAANAIVAITNAKRATLKNVINLLFPMYAKNSKIDLILINNQELVHKLVWNLTRKVAMYKEFVAPQEIFLLENK